MSGKRRLIVIVAGMLVLLAGIEAGDWTAAAVAQPAGFPAPIGKPVVAPDLLRKAQSRRPFGLFEFLFGAPRARRPRAGVGPPEDDSLRQEPATLARPAVPKDPDAQRVYVFGDAFAVGLASGLNAAYAETPTIEIVGRTKADSGLVRDDYYDWNAALADILASERVDVAVVMIGSNDRQPISFEDGSREPVRSEKWEQTYISRVDALLRQFADKGIPLYWIGLPIMRPEAYAQDMAYLNEVYLARVQRAGGKFIDTWERFADEEGRYSAEGPDVSGKPRTLRADNGIHLTGTGNKKLAFFVEQVLNADLGASGLARLTNVAPGAGPGGLRGPVEIELSLTSPETPPADAVLAGAAPREGAEKPANDPENPRADYRLLVVGESPPPEPGRADDFSWPRGSAGRRPSAPGEETSFEIP